jgi:hypothetical protein
MLKAGMRILVLGYIVRGPLAGHTWHHLQYLMGLAQQGHDVYFLEDSDDFESCYDPASHEVTADPTAGLVFAKRIFARIGMETRWAYHDAHTGTWHGPAASMVDELCRTAEICLNVSGVNPLRDWMIRVPVRVLVDTDPAFTQIRHLTDPRAMQAALRHTAFFSFGENIGSDDCTIPDDGLAWQPTRQPIVLDAWAVTPGPAGGAFTTMMQWESYPAMRYDGRTYGMKSASFQPYFDLPGKIGAQLEVAVGGASAPREELRQHGWIVRDPMPPSLDPWAYQRFLQEAKAEFTVAKWAYVSSASGWFSDRSAEFLACGRPVVTQETGFSKWLPTGGGLFAFSSAQEAVAAIEQVCADYESHCRAARELAAEYFDARRVLASLLDRALAGSCAAG